MAGMAGDQAARGGAVSADGGAAPSGSAVGGELPRVHSPLSADEIVKRLDALARQGKLPGFAKGEGGVLFRTAAFSEPFDRELLARAEPAAGAAGSGAKGTTLRFSLRVLPRVPLIYAAVIGTTIWPGVWLTDSMLKTYFDWYKVETWWWYMPVTVLPLLWAMPRMWRKCARAAEESAREMIGKIAEGVGSV